MRDHLFCCGCFETLWQNNCYTIVPAHDTSTPEIHMQTLPQKQTENGMGKSLDFFQNYTLDHTFTELELQAENGMGISLDFLEICHLARTIAKIISNQHVEQN